MGGSWSLCEDDSEIKSLKQLLEKEVEEGNTLDDRPRLTEAVRVLSELNNPKEREEYAEDVMRFFKGLVKRCLLLHLQGKIHCGLQPESIYLQNGVVGQLMKTSDPAISNRQVEGYDQIKPDRFSKDDNIYVDPKLQDVPHSKDEVADWKARKLKAMIFNLGAILFYCLAGKAYKKPENQSFEEGLKDQLTNLPFKGPKGQELIKFIARAMNEDLLSRLSWATICVEWLSDDILASPNQRELRGKLATYDDLYFNVRLLLEGIVLAERIECLRTRIPVSNISSFYNDKGNRLAIPKLDLHYDQMIELANLQSEVLKVLATDLNSLRLQFDFVAKQGLLIEAESVSLDDEFKLILKNKYASILKDKYTSIQADESETAYLDRLHALRRAAAQKASNILVNLSMPSASRPNVLTESFSKENSYPIFGLVYEWVNCRAELISIKRQLYLDWRAEPEGILNEEHKQQHDAGLRRATFLAGPSAVEIPLLIELITGDPRYKIAGQSFASSSECFMYHGVIQQGSSETKVVYKLLKKGFANPDNIFRESQTLAQISRNKHVLRPIVSLKVYQNEEGLQKLEVHEFARNAKPLTREAYSDYYIVSEFIPFGTLDKYVESFPPGGLPISQVLFLIRGIIAGMIALREARLTHRDLKPENIMLAEHLIPVIVDLGSGLLGNIPQKFQEGDSDAELVIDRGTQIWSGPEMMLAKQSVLSGDQAPPQDDKVDVWSLGMILYYLLYGYAAYTQHQYYTEFNEFCANKEANKFDDFIDHCPDRKMRDCETGRALQEIYRKCIRFDKEKRMNWNDLINHELLQVNINQIERPENDFTATTELFKRGVNWVFNCKVLNEMLVKLFPDGFADLVQAVQATLIHQANTKVKELSKQERAGLMLDIFPFGSQHERTFYQEVSKKLEVLLISKDQHAADNNLVGDGRLLPKVTALVERFKTLPYYAQNSDVNSGMKPLLGYLMAVGHDEKNAHYCFTIYPQKVGSAELGAEKFMSLASEELQSVIDCNGYAFYTKYCT